MKIKLNTLNEIENLDSEHKLFQTPTNLFLGLFMLETKLTVAWLITSTIKSKTKCSSMLDSSMVYNRQIYERLFYKEET